MPAVAACCNLFQVKFASGVTAALAAILIAAPVAVADDSVVDPIPPACVADSSGNCVDHAPATDGATAGSEDPGATTEGSDSQSGAGSTEGSDSGSGSEPGVGSTETTDSSSGSTDGSDAAGNGGDTGSGSGPTDPPTPEPCPAAETPDAGASCPLPVDPPILCALARFASQADAESAGCGGPVVKPVPVDCVPAPDEDKTECPLYKPEPPTVDPTGPVDPTGFPGCFKSDGGFVACYDTLGPGRDGHGGPKITERGGKTTKSGSPQTRSHGPKARSRSVKAKHRKRAKLRKGSKAKAGAKAKRTLAKRKR